MTPQQHVAICKRFIYIACEYPTGSKENLRYIALAQRHANAAARLLKKPHLIPRKET